MSAVQPLQTNEAVRGFAENEKEVSKNFIGYAPCSKTGRDGPNQVLFADKDVTSDPDGRVRIKLTKDDMNSFQPLSVPGLFEKVAETYPNSIALVCRPDVSGNRRTYTYKQYLDDIRKVAKAFVKLGLKRHHSVCILGFNSPEWFISDVAAIYAGGVSAGIYTTNSPEACLYCAQSSRANIIVVEDDKQLEKILQIKKDLPDLKAIIQYDGVPKQKDVLSWQELLDIGERESDDKLNDVLKTIGINECCILVYTSGTVGNPKAVMLSHDNMVSNTQAIITAMKFKFNYECLVSYLPLSHIAAQLVDVFSCAAIAGTIYFADKNALKGSLVQTLVVARPTTLLGVPRVWEKIYEKMQLVARNNGTIKTWISNWAKAQGLYYNMNKMNGVDYKHWGYLIAKWLVFNKVKAALGLSRCNICVTAAAPLSSDIKKYFISLDIPIMEAYGMSECSAHAIGVRDSCRLDSIGTVLEDFSTKIDDPDVNGEGEICMSGRHVFMGYMNEPDKTAETIDKNNWLHSGDLGKLDADGRLYITGRIKELIITAGGENIPPVHIENLVLHELPALSNALLIGDRRKYLTILVTLKTDMDENTGEPLDTLTADNLKWLSSIGSNAKTVKEIINTHDTYVYEEIDKAIKRANEKAISNAQKVQKFRLLPHDFSNPTGELGPTLKVRRNIVHKMYADLIEEMYK